MENGQRIEAKIDELTKQVSDIRESSARCDERTKGLQEQFALFSKTRAASCPMATILEGQTRRIESVKDDIIEDRGTIGELERCTGNLKVSHRTNKMLFIILSGVVGVAGSLVGILAAVGVI